MMLHTWQSSKQVGVSLLHVPFHLPGALLTGVIVPLDFNHGNLFVPELLDLPVHNNCGILLIDCTLVQLNGLRLKDMRCIWNVLSQHGDVEDWMYMTETGR